MRNAKGPEFDRLFLSGMIQHHKGALVMVKDLFDSPAAGQDADLFNFATDVDNTQRAEIRIMQNLLAKNYVTTSVTHFKENHEPSSPRQAVRWPRPRPLLFSSLLLRSTRRTTRVPVRRSFRRE